MLYNILTNRDAVNSLKILSDEGKVVPLEETELDEKSAKMLLRHGLIQFEKHEKKLVTASLKGKQFIKLMDELKELVEKEMKKRSVKISFSLSDEERKVLLLISKLGFRAGRKMLLGQLKKQKVVRSAHKLNKLLESLSQINLVKLDSTAVEITEIGKQTIINDLLEEFNLI